MQLSGATGKKKKKKKYVDRKKVTLADKCRASFLVRQ